MNSLFQNTTALRMLCSCMEKRETNAADEQAAGMKVGKMGGSMLTGSSGTVLLEDQQRSFLNRIQ